MKQKNVIVKDLLKYSNLKDFVIVMFLFQLILLVVNSDLFKTKSLKTETGNAVSETFLYNRKCPKRHNSS